MRHASKCRPGAATVVPVESCEDLQEETSEDAAPSEGDYFIG